MRGIHASMLGEYVRAATWRRAVRALEGPRERLRQIFNYRRPQGAGAPARARDDRARVSRGRDGKVRGLGSFRAEARRELA